MTGTEDVRLETFLLCSILIFTQVASKIMFVSLTGDLLNAVLCSQGVCMYTLVSSVQTLFLMHAQAVLKRVWYNDEPYIAYHLQ